MSVAIEYTEIVGTVGWALAFLALVIKTDWKSGPDSLRRRLTFLYDVLILTFISITFVFALSFKFPDLNGIENKLEKLIQSETESTNQINRSLQRLQVIANTLEKLVKTETELKNQTERLGDVLTYFSETTKHQFEQLCREHTDNFQLPEVIEKELGLTDGIEKFSIKFDQLSASCTSTTEYFDCKCN